MENTQKEKIQETFSGIVTLLEKIETLISDDGFGKVVSMNNEIFEGMKKETDNMLSVEDIVEKNYKMALDCVEMLKDGLPTDVLIQMRLQIIELALKTNLEATHTIYTNLHNFAKLTSSGIEWNKLSENFSCNIGKNISDTNIAIMDIMKEINEN